MITKHRPEQLFHRRAVLALCALDFVTEFTSNWITNASEGVTHMHLYSIANIILVTTLFVREFSPKRSKVIALFSGSVAAGVAIVFGFVYGISTMYNVPSGIIQIVILFLCISYFFRIFVEMEIPNLGRNLFFWIASALLIYHGGTYFNTIFQSSIRAEQNQLFLVTWQIQLYTSILYNLILAIGVWQTRHRSYLQS